MFGSKFSIRRAIGEGWELSLTHIWLLIKVACALFAVQLVLGLGAAPFLAFIGKHMPSFHQDATGRVIAIGATSWQFNLVFLLFAAYALFAFFVFFTLLQLGVTRVALDLYEKGKSAVGRFFGSFYLLLPYIGAIILLALIMVIPHIIAGPLAYGAMKLQLPMAALTAIRVLRAVIGLFLAVRFMFFIYGLVDKNLGSVESLKYSWHLTKGSELRLIVLNALLGLIFGGFGAIGFFSLRSLLVAISAGNYMLGVMPALFLAGALFAVALALPATMLAHVSAYKQLGKAKKRR